MKRHPDEKIAQPSEESNHRQITIPLSLKHAKALIIRCLREALLTPECYPDRDTDAACYLGIFIDTIRLSPDIPPDCIIELWETGSETTLARIWASRPEYLNEVWRVISPHLPKPPRQRRYGDTRDKVREVNEFIKDGLSKTTACKRVGIDIRTYNKYNDDERCPLGDEKPYLEVEV